MTRVAGRTSTRVVPVAMVRRRATAITRRQVDGMAETKTGEGSTGSRHREMIAPLRSRIGRAQGHNRPAIAADGSASLPVLVNGRTIIPAAGETVVAANRSWSSTSLSSLRATRLLMGATPGDMTVAITAAMIAATTAVGWGAEIPEATIAAAAMIVGLRVVTMAAVAMIMGLPVATAVAMIEVPQVTTMAAAMIEGQQAATVAAVAMIVEQAAAAEITEAAETAETVAVAAAETGAEAEVRKAEEENLPAPGRVKSGANAFVADSECQPQANEGDSQTSGSPPIFTTLCNFEARAGLTKLLCRFR